MSYCGQTRLRLSEKFVSTLPAGMAKDRKRLNVHLANQLIPRLEKAVLCKPLNELLHSCVRLSGLASRMDYLRLRLKLYADEDDDLAKPISQSQSEAVNGLNAMARIVGHIENHIADFLNLPNADALARLHFDASLAVTRVFADLGETTVLGRDHCLALLLLVMGAVPPLPKRQAELLDRLACDQKQIPADRMIGVPNYPSEIITKDLSAKGKLADPKLGDQIKTIEHLASIFGSANKAALILLDARPDECQARIKSGVLYLATEQLVDVHMFVHDFLAEAIFRSQADDVQPVHLGILMGAEWSTQQLLTKLERVLQYIAAASWVYSPDFIAALDPLLSHVKRSIKVHPASTPELVSFVAFLKPMGMLSAPCAGDPVKLDTPAPAAENCREDQVQVKRLDIHQTFAESDSERLFRAFQHINQHAPGKQPSRKEGSVVTDANRVALTREQCDAHDEFIRRAFGPGTIGGWEIHNSENPEKPGKISGLNDKLIVEPLRQVGPHIIPRQDSDRSEYRLLKIRNDCFRLERQKDGGKFHEDLRNRLTRELADLERARMLNATDATVNRPNFTRPDSILNSSNSALEGLKTLGIPLEPAELPPPCVSQPPPANDPLKGDIFFLPHPRSSKSLISHQKVSLLKGMQDAKNAVDLVHIILKARTLVRAQLHLEQSSQQIQPTAKCPVIGVPTEAMASSAAIPRDAQKSNLDSEQPVTEPIKEPPQERETRVKHLGNATAVPTNTPGPACVETVGLPHPAPLGSVVPSPAAPGLCGDPEVTPAPAPTRDSGTANQPTGMSPVAEMDPMPTAAEPSEAGRKKDESPVPVADSANTKAAANDPIPKSKPLPQQVPSGLQKQADKNPNDTTAVTTTEFGTHHLQTELVPQHQGALAPIALGTPKPDLFNPAKDATTIAPDQIRRSQDESEPAPATEFRTVPPPLAKSAVPAVSADKKPSPAVASTEPPSADIPPSPKSSPDYPEDLIRNIEDGKTPPADTSLIPDTDPASLVQIGFTPEPDSIVTSNLCSPSAPSGIQSGDVQRTEPPSASESCPSPSPNQAAENHETVGPQSQNETTPGASDHGASAAPELTFYVPDLLIDAAEEAAKSGRFDMLRKPCQVAYYLASFGWPLAGNSAAFRENELVLLHNGEPIHLRLDETLFILQLALARGRMRAYPTWNFELQSMLGRDAECQVQHGLGGYLNPFHDDLLKLEEKLKDPIFAASWMGRSRSLDYTKRPMEIAADLCMKFIRSNQELAVLLTALHYRSHKYGYLNFDNVLRRNCYYPHISPSYITRVALRLPVLKSHRN